MFHPRSPAPFIDDGYTRQARIDAGAFHPAVLFEYRPMGACDRAALRRRLRPLAADESVAMPAVEAIVAGEVARRLVSWTLVDRAGRPLTVSEAAVRRLETHLLLEMATIVLGLAPGNDARDAAEERNLLRAARLTALAPHLVTRDCDDCLRHVYDETTGRRAHHAGRPVPRPPGTRPPCRLPHVGCLKGSPEDSHAPTANNLAAIRFHRECELAGTFPDDPLVRRHAILIRSVDREIARRHSSLNTRRPARAL